jgi:hypothetical protein
MVIGAEALGDSTREGPLVLIARGADRERLDPRSGALGHQADQEARVQASGQRGADRRVGRQVALDRRAETPAQLGRQACSRCRAAARRVRRAAAHQAGRPREGLRARLSILPEGHPMSRRQPCDPSEERQRTRYETKPQEAVECGRIEPPRQAGGEQQRLCLGGKPPAPLVAEVVHRLHAARIARQEQTLPRLVPQRQREHALQAGKGRRPLLLEGMDHRLRVGAGGEAVTARLEPAAELAMVVDLAIADQVHSAVFAGQRLRAVGGAHDGQAVAAQGRGVPGQLAHAVRPAVTQRRAQNREALRVRWAGEAEDAAHPQGPPPRGGDSTAQTLASPSQRSLRRKEAKRGSPHGIRSGCPGRHRINR